MGTLRTPSAAALAVAAALALPHAAGAQATLTVDPNARCYRERSAVLLPGTGFTPNGAVVFSRGEMTIDPPIVANGAGELSPTLVLPGLTSGQQRLTYVATDQTTPTLSAQVSVLVSATDVDVTPDGGPPHRLLTIRARGFMVPDHRTLYAHVVRVGGRGRARARNLRIGRLTGSCARVRARKRLFVRGTAPGRYRVQFDTFRRYERRRTVKSELAVRVFQDAGSARASAVSPAS